MTEKESHTFLEAVDKDQLMSEIASHWDALLTFAKGRTNDPNTAEDLVQETMTKAFERIDQLRDRSNILAWLKQILVNHQKDDWRKKHGTKPEKVQTRQRAVRELIESFPCFKGARLDLRAHFSADHAETDEPILDMAADRALIHFALGMNHAMDIQTEKRGKMPTDPKERAVAMDELANDIWSYMLDESHWTEDIP